jgi:hypothetical protein|tara:strand:+ start:307 stop:522 length:216 start_codon:yes stop_codon:yes gene_type:complete
MKTKKTNKMNTVVKLNWRIKDIIEPKLSFKSWYAEVFKTDAPKALLSKINKKDKELEQMKKEVLKNAVVSP